MKYLCRELADECASLDKIVSKLNDSQWSKVTSFYNWTVKEEICHIAYFDNKAVLAAKDSEGFQKDAVKILEGVTLMDYFWMDSIAELLTLSNKQLMDFWVRERMKMIHAFGALDPLDKLPWYGPPMTVRSLASARIMETWAHGQDIVDALNIQRASTDRLKHIAHIGVKTFGWSYQNRGLKKPTQKVRVELKGSTGDTWLWNERIGENSIVGSATDFCLVVTQRRHVHDTRLALNGDIAREWMTLAQAFAGPPEKGPNSSLFK